MRAIDLELQAFKDLDVYDTVSRNMLGYVNDLNVADDQIRIMSRNRSWNVFKNGK